MYLKKYKKCSKINHNIYNVNKLTGVRYKAWYFIRICEYFMPEWSAL